jgi:hypothetical protein
LKKFVASIAAVSKQPTCAKKKIKSRRARNEDETWDHAALKAEHAGLINAGSLAPTRMLANRYDVATTTIKEILAENAAANANNDLPILHSHDPFGRCKRSA